ISSDPMNIFRLLVGLLRVLVWKLFLEFHRIKTLTTSTKNANEMIYTDMSIETAVDLVASCNTTLLRVHTGANDESFNPLTRKDVTNFGVAVEAFFPYVAVEKTIKVKGTGTLSPSSNPFVEQFVAANCSPFRESSTVSCALSSTTGQSYIEDSYGLHTGANFIAAIEDSDDERFMKFAERELAYDRMVISESMQEEANERFMLIKASQKATVALGTPSKLGETDTTMGSCISGAHVKCDISFNGSPLSHSSPKSENSAQRSEASNCYWKSAWISPGSSGLDINERNKKESFPLARLSSNGSDESVLSNANDDQEAGDHHEEVKQLDDVDISVNCMFSNLRATIFHYVT
uniref:Uncharacterized protein n=1 Tax=Parascaris univalens TaxID=6257 RepID=A0A915ACK9_PARUN